MIDKEQVERLALLIKSGDSDKFTELFDVCYPWIYKTALKQIRNKTDAEEAASDILTKIWQNLDKWDPKNDSNFMPHGKLFDFFAKMCFTL